ncbi:VOC family protein [Kitasatospora sp. NPDC002227]|uniref:VOC family protein n=1 Tax=Kitasatospora sp. NPDC002227 TaxID=3154773 RepID=UPI003332FA2C
MRVTSSVLSLTVADPAASRDFFCTYLGYQVALAEGDFTRLARPDEAVDLVLLRRGAEVLPPEQREQRAAGLIVALTVTNLAAEQERLRAAGAPITLPLTEEPWGERLLQLTDPNGVVVQLVEWVTAEEPQPRVIDADPAHVTVSPNARMTGLAAPSRGSAELSTWTAEMAAGQAGPEHVVSREQVWTVTAGSLQLHWGGRSETVTAGQTMVIPAGLARKITAPEDFRAHIAMRVDGMASAPGGDAARTIPWAE